MTTYGPRRARRTDDNHSEIRDALRGGSPVFLEVKRVDTRHDLTDSERRARNHWGAAWHVVTTVEEALLALGAI